MGERARVFVALGSNLPHGGLSGPALLARAVAALRSAGLTVRARSGVWRSPAWPPGAGQPDYVNAVVELDPKGLSPQPLYRTLCVIEEKFGRERRERWASRTLDLDIVAMDGFEGAAGGLTLPHPRMHERAFVLAPMAEIAPGWRHPTLGKSVGEMLAKAALAGPGCRRLGDLGGA
jgi:2-amino-4-hydroxy-6-hydroxymethyldihydropteridine diphosphokinase